MKKEVVQSFTARVTQATRSELIVILYEMTLIQIKEANEAFVAGDLPLFDKELKKAQKFVNELIVSLDFKYALSYDLFSLYLYVNKQIVTALIKRKPDSLEGAQSVLDKLLVGFHGVSREDKSAPMMRNTQQLYAGLTYGKGKLNETYLDPNNSSRGFIA